MRLKRYIHVIKLTLLYVPLVIFTGCCIIIVVFNIKRESLTHIFQFWYFLFFFLTHSIDREFKKFRIGGNLSFWHNLVHFSYKEAIQQKFNDVLRVRLYLGRIRSYSFSNVLLKVK